MVASYEKFRATNTFGSLDGLRAISIIMVIWHHVASPYYYQFHILRHGHLGVHFFFAISGFLITTLLLRERDGCGTISLKHFYLRRSLRIFPLYYAVILLYIVVVTLMERQSPYGMAFYGNLKYYFTYTSNWFVTLDQPRVIFYLAWSLATEEQFYLMWPLVEKFFKGSWPVFIALGLIVVSFTTSINLYEALIPQGSLLWRMMTGIAIPICLGVLLAHLLHSRKGFELARRVFGARWSCLVFFALLALLFSPPVERITPTHYLFIYITMAAIVASCVIREDHYLAKVLGIAPFKLIGVLSYGMYLLHMLCFHAVKVVGERIDLTHPLSNFVATTLLTIGAAWISYTFFESYFLNLKKRFSRVAPARLPVEPVNEPDPISTAS